METAVLTGVDEAVEELFQPLKLEGVELEEEAKQPVQESPDEEDEEKKKRRVYETRAAEEKGYESSASTGYSSNDSMVHGYSPDERRAATERYFGFPDISFSAADFAEHHRGSEEHDLHENAGHSHGYKDQGHDHKNDHKHEHGDGHDDHGMHYIDGQGHFHTHSNKAGYDHACGGCNTNYGGSLGGEASFTPCAQLSPLILNV